MTRFPAADDPIPATVFGTRYKPPGALGLLIRGVGVAFICRARAKVLAAAARLCIRHKLTLLTTDEDFSRIAKHTQLRLWMD